MTAPRSPYPPDPPEGAPPPVDLLDVTDGRIEHGELANIRAFRSSLQRVELHLCRLTGAELAEASWQDVTLTECRLDLTGFRFARLERVVFRDCNLEEADFAGATLRDVLFERCRLRLAVVSGVKTERVDLLGCELEGLSGVDALRGVRMRWEDVAENAVLFARALGIEIADAE